MPVTSQYPIMWSFLDLVAEQVITRIMGSLLALRLPLPACRPKGFTHSAGHHFGRCRSTSIQKASVKNALIALMSFVLCTSSFVYVCPEELDHEFSYGALFVHEAPSELWHNKSPYLETDGSPITHALSGPVATAKTGNPRLIEIPDKQPVPQKMDRSGLSQEITSLKPEAPNELGYIGSCDSLNISASQTGIRNPVFFVPSPGIPEYKRQGNHWILDLLIPTYFVAMLVHGPLIWRWAQYKKFQNQPKFRYLIQLLSL